MKNRYDAVMDHVQLTEAMRARILQRLQDAPLESAAPKAAALKRYLALAACLVLVVACAFFAPRLTRAPLPQEPVQTLNRAVEAESADALSELVGYEILELTDLPFAPQQVQYTAFPGQMAQISYESAAQTITLRQSPGEGDNSGDYTVYEGEKQVLMDDTAVTLRGADEAYCLALWRRGGRAYSLRLSAGIEEAALLSLIRTLL